MGVQTFLPLIAEQAVHRPNRMLPFVPVVCRSLILGRILEVKACFVKGYFKDMTALLSFPDPRGVLTEIPADFVSCKSNDFASVL